jgi:two-component system, sensor histidine kinase and response regulator
MLRSNQARPETDMAESELDHNVLIVDDTLKNIQVLGTILRQEGYQISVAQNGEQALDAVGRVHPDLILLDIRMPVMDGLETCRRLKADPSTSGIPVIFLTAEADPDDIVRGFRLGAVDYVTKPFNAEELLSRVNTHLTINSLQITLKKRVHELNEALSRIEILHREQDAFLRHELGNAISPIIGYADLLKMQSAAQLSDDSHGWLQKIIDGGNEMNSLLVAVKQLQDIERGDYELDIHELDLSLLLSDIAAEFETPEEGAVRIELEGARNPFPIYADPALLPGVFRNLFRNGAEHVGELKSEDERVVRAVLHRRDDGAIVCVQNGGPPIPDQLLETFFEKFNSTRKAKGGTGLGTSYIDLVVRAHRGSVSVSSSNEAGTCVTIQLPRSPRIQVVDIVSGA